MSARILVVYETHYGTCARIAEHVERRIRARGFDFDVEAAPDGRPFSLDDYAGVIVIAAVYNQHHPESIERFIQRHAHSLGRRSTAFISVSIGAAARLRFVRAGIRRVAERLFQKTGWHPSHVLYAGGTLDYPVYTPAMRRWVRGAAFVFGLPTDTTRRHELTHWNEVDDLVDTLIGDLETTQEMLDVACIA